MDYESKLHVCIDLKIFGCNECTLCIDLEIVSCIECT